MYNLRGCLARKERQFHDALRYLSRAVRRAPQGGDARFLYDRAQCYADMGQWPEVGEDVQARVWTGCPLAAKCNTGRSVLLCHISNTQLFVRYQSASVQRCSCGDTVTHCKASTSGGRWRGSASVCFQLAAP